MDVLFVLNWRKEVIYTWHGMQIMKILFLGNPKNQLFKILLGPLYIYHMYK